MTNDHPTDSPEQPDETPDTPTSTEDADRANGEPDATHPTGEQQAAENRENDPPA